MPATPERHPHGTCAGAPESPAYERRTHFEAAPESLQQQAHTSPEHCGSRRTFLFASFARSAFGSAAWLGSFPALDDGVEDRTRKLLTELMGHTFRRQLLENTLVAAMLTFHPSPRWLKDEGTRITPWVGRKTRGFPKCAPCATRRNRVACPWGSSCTSGTCGACARRWSRRRGRGRGAERGGEGTRGGANTLRPAAPLRKFFQSQWIALRSHWPS